MARVSPNDSLLSPRVVKFESAFEGDALRANISAACALAKKLSMRVAFSKCNFITIHAIYP